MWVDAAEWVPSRKPREGLRDDTIATEPFAAAQLRDPVLRPLWLGSQSRRDSSLLEPRMGLWGLLSDTPGAAWRRSNNLLSGRRGPPKGCAPAGTLDAARFLRPWRSFQLRPFYSVSRS